MEDPLMRFHRLLWETEDSNRANQLDKLVQILKDRPIKYSLAKNPAPVLPPLSVVRKLQRKEMIHREVTFVAALSNVVFCQYFLLF